MEASALVMWFGFILAAYSVVGNDVIQTLGTFLTSNEKRVKWYVLWFFASAVMVAALINGYIQEDISYGRLAKFETPETYEWYLLFPPLVLLIITRMGIPVSTTFMILTLFSLSTIPNDLPEMVSSIFNTDERLGGMVHKSLIGYILAFGSAIVIYLSISTITEKRFLENKLTADKEKFWIIAQWLTTGFLWFQWLTQDLANIYIYLQGGNDLSLTGFIMSMLVLVVLLGYIFYNRGGAVQNVVRVKTNTTDIRAATFIDLIYGIILYIFKYNYLDLFEAKLPMSTTWVFIGLLAGREIAINIRLKNQAIKNVFRMILSDLIKVFIGLVVSIGLVFMIKLLAT